MEKTPANLHVLSLGKALIWKPLPLSGRQVVGTSSLPIVVTQFGSRLTDKGAHKYEWTNFLKKCNRENYIAILGFNFLAEL